MALGFLALILLQRLAVRAVERTRFLQQADLARQGKVTTAAIRMVALQQVVVALAQLVVQTAEATEGQAVQVALLILLIAVAEAVRVQHTVLLAQAGAVAVVLVVRILPTEATARRTQAVAVAGVEATQHRQAGKAEAEL